MAGVAAPLPVSRGLAGAEGTPPALLWQADPARGPAALFEGLEREPGDITVADDPQGRYGASIRYETWDVRAPKERCESRGLRRPDGSVLRIDSSYEGRTLYVGWRALWADLDPRARQWIAVYQLKASGNSVHLPGAGPVVLRTLGDGRLYLQVIPPRGGSRHIWSMPFPLNEWHSFVVGVKVSRGEDGWIEFWHNGEQQRFTDGRTRYPLTTLWGAHLNHKWGVYRSGRNSGRAVAYVNAARLGTSYASVAP